jgi:endonuclease-3 related protein
MINYIYETLLKRFGKQRWWSGSPPFEVIIGTVLAQHTTWDNALRALQNLERSSLLEARTLSRASPRKIRELVRPAGLHRQKTKRITNISDLLATRYGGDLGSFFDRPLEEIRDEMLSMDGIGRETADSILLYAANKAIFPVDEYTMRFSKRHGTLSDDYRYENLRVAFERQLPRDPKIYKELRALIVKLGKTYCKKIRPKCASCPLERCMFRGQTVLEESPLCSR